LLRLLHLRRRALPAGAGGSGAGAQLAFLAPRAVLGLITGEVNHRRRAGLAPASITDQRSPGWTAIAAIFSAAVRVS
jgi:hypothetical protein